MEKSDEEKLNKLYIVIFGSIGLCIIVGAYLLYDHISTSSVLRSTLESLHKVGNNFEIKINGKMVTEKNAVLKELKKVKIIGAHHSSRTKRIDVEIIAPGINSSLVLYRDSDIKDEYWVYLAGKSREIGRIKTNIFDSF